MDYSSLLEIALLGLTTCKETPLSLHSLLLIMQSQMHLEKQNGCVSKTV